MVYVKRLELSNFKSFGGTTQIPLLPGFTVVSGPNGSGKSNILDALLFALGLASSKGMRAERLPDLVNHNQSNRGRSTVELSVTVTFDLEDDPALEQACSNGQESQKSAEWSVTRKLRVTKQDTYTSTYYINAVPCTLTELHEQLNRLRIYPEGYNVVLQGDVTSIISMNSRERRLIIDELAGVAAFDRKIVQAKDTLDEVKEKEDRCRIVEKELITQRDRLSQDRLKAEKYQKLRAELQTKTQWEAVLVWRAILQQQEQLIEQIQAGERITADLTNQLATLTLEIEKATDELNQLNNLVKALGEDELLALQSMLATQEAEQRQLQQRQRELEQACQHITSIIKQQAIESQEHQHSLEQLIQEQHIVQTPLASLRVERDEVRLALNNAREAGSARAAASEAWVQQQAALNRQIEKKLQTLEPQRTEQAQLRERNSQVASQIQEQSQLIDTLELEIADKQPQLAHVQALSIASSTEIEFLAQSLAAAEQELQILQETQLRLLQEQREKQRASDKLEAQAQAIQETQGTYATKVILQSGLSGVCGLVVQLGRVEPRYQLALETAGGGRLGHLVVEDDAVAAEGIELLKQKRAGRATFLPLNKIQPPRLSPTAAVRYANGFVDFAINLIDCDRRYQDVFAYVFGNTVVFETLDKARSALGQHRIVTLSGELLETSGAMTGGSNIQRSGLHFDTSDATESDEAAQLKNRLQEISLILERCFSSINLLSAKTKRLAQELMEAKANRRESQLQCEQLQKEILSWNQRLEGTRKQVLQTENQLSHAAKRLEVLDRELPQQEATLQELKRALAELEQTQAPNEWQQIQAIITSNEQQLQEREQTLRTAEQRLKDLENTALRLKEKIQELKARKQEYSTLQTEKLHQVSDISASLTAISSEIARMQAEFRQREQQLSQEKQKRDRAEQQLRSRHLTQQQMEWQQQKEREIQCARRQELAILQTQMQIQVAELPLPLPEVPQVNLEHLQQEMRSLSKRLQAMEPVNMLALEEYDRTTKRLEELTQKLVILEDERTELLLRIENFTTLRQRAFKEAFDAVNENFQSIFAILSEGDGYLQLDDAQDPNNSGLNLVAHPKGKPIQRLASMSGGEKSLTALSFIFALQRYRPSPFYAFDEVDMFLDGANVERLARMIEQQAQQAQFIVVSLRRPMIESAERTIGVTQARGAYTQVLGLKLQSPNTLA